MRDDNENINPSRKTGIISFLARFNEILLKQTSHTPYRITAIEYLKNSTELTPIPLEYSGSANNGLVP